ncbi:AzlC family ABC transporter permease [Streptococcus himalayensis]|uniref:Branched-chain amino acid permease n=1 Tax=Streptococcus himalayensis TaxID=1888195 RepID=A0A917A848_9STRE|nr:AzlC family ABC transporter permease [Streptococcus himalayensis]GGE34779.1 branched-chain amino acid permease [Streptococcus himalayensis]
MEEQNWKAGIRAGMPTALGYIGIGLACGVIAAPYLNPLEMFLMSVLVYAGSAQFVMIAMIALKSSLTDIALTVFLINIRFFLLSLHTSTFFRKDSLWKNLAIGSILTDESYGVLLAAQLRGEEPDSAWMVGNNIVSYVSWALSTTLGTLLGHLLPNPEMFGLDFALVGMFLGIFSSQFLVMVKKEKLVKIMLILAATAISFFGLTMVVSQSLAVLCATLLGCSVGVMLDGK